MSSYSGSSSGSDQMFFRVGSSQASSTSGSSRSSVSTNSSRTSGSSFSSHMSYASNSSGRSSNSGSVRSTTDKWQPYIDTKVYANREHNKLGWSGPRLGEDPLVTAQADKTSDKMERKAKAERKVQSEKRKKGGYYIEGRKA
ncbi:hypothetical protein BGAL_0179g00140 [Botrytis galanthina]|uniref:Uncharacterized protein n=1 Tax=Botrytis galanthina TaxID=278940 RepID=A0A4S8R6C5_9HELO|nr:hypothetical protein BGAL_0179g00140 [Botrytis galanthina]